MLCQLKRFTEAPVTLGLFFVEGIPFLATLELPWKGNQHNISCIPEGTYICKEVFNVKLHNGHVLPRTFEVTGVKDRSGILFHTGNFAKDTLGCILIGRSFGRPEQMQIWDSKLGFTDFLLVLNEVREFTLEVVYDSTALF